jgi:flagellar basal body rod protein FlgB
MESPLIANGAETYRISGGVEISKNRTKYTSASVKYEYLCTIVSKKMKRRNNTLQT